MEATNIDPGAVLACVDHMDSEGFLARLHPQVVFRFGNAPAVIGHDALRPVLDGFFGALGGIAHALDAHWRIGDDLFCHGQVTYTRTDGSTLAVPFANVFRFEGDLIADYLIFVDNHELFATD